MELIRRLLVGLLGMIDGVVYYLIELIYGLLLEIARAKPFSNEIFSTFAERIYALLGLFMLFKVSFSLIKYIVNPDEFNDKVKGGKKMVMNILIVLVLIVTTPIAFDYMAKIQETLLNENVMEKLILGTGVNGQPVDQNAVGANMKVEIFSAFYSLEADAPEITKTAYEEAKSRGSVEDMIHKEVNGEPLFMHKKTTGDGYAINYMFIVSTIAGIFTAWIFLTFCIDIAIRTVKLGFLQLISPIPIISYIDPSSSKNGMFSKWLKEVGKTWADLFIRLGAVYFAITLISALMSQDSIAGTSNPLAKVFIIIGILIFANQIPKLIGDLLGVKIDGNFSLNPMKKINSSPIANAVVGGAAGFVGGGVANAAAKFMNAERDDDGHIINKGNTVKQMLLSGTGGALMGAGRAGIAGTSGKTSAIKNVSSAIERNSRIRNYNDKYGGAIKGTQNRITDQLTTMAGIKYSSGSTNQIKSEIQIKQRELSNVQLQEKALEEARLNLVNRQGAAVGGLLKTFDYKVKEYDAKGRVVSYEDKNYNDYAMNELRSIVEASGGNWAAMSVADRQSALQHQITVTGRIVSQDTFEQINDIYKAKGTQDIQEAKLQKDITELEETRDLGKNMRPGGGK